MCLTATAQHWEIDRYQLDSLQEYTAGVDTYTFYLSSGSQGLYFNISEVSRFPQTYLRIVNNTGGTVIARHRMRDSHVMWFRASPLNDTLAPGDAMVLFPGTANAGSVFSYPFSSTINITYLSEGEEFSCVIQTWGKVSLNNDFAEKTDSNNKQMYSRETTSSHSYVERKPDTSGSQFEFRKDLWIYPKTTDSSLPTNLTLKYFINDSACFAKKRLDTLNQVYFKIPMKLGDSVYCVLSSPEYGFIFKKKIVREQVNKLEISFEIGAKLNEPHYYDGSGSRIAIKSSFIGCYYIPRDYKISDFSQKRLDSLNALVKSFDAFLKYGMDGGLIIKCKPEFAIQIKKKLGNLDFYQIIDENAWITDLYKLDFSLPLSKEKVSALLNKYGITEIYIEPSQDNGNNLDTNTIRNISFRMENLPGNIKNCKIISELLSNMEVLRVTQSTIKFFGHAND